MQIQRQEDDIRTRVSVASDAYRKAVQEAQAIRQEYFNFQLPRILRVRIRALTMTFRIFTRPMSVLERMCRRDRPWYTVPSDTLCLPI